MAKRGRRSAAEMAVVVTGTFGQRPEPPEDLTEPQAEIWRKTVASEDAAFFNSAALRGLLMDYCRHRDAAESISGIINSFEPAWLKSKEGCQRYHSLLKMRDLETRAAAGMATKLRLTNQSRYVPHVAARVARDAQRGVMPWDDA